MKTFALLILGAIFALPAFARADTYLYDITLEYRAQATFETTSLITTQTSITSFISCTTGGDGGPLEPCNGVTVTPNFAYNSSQMYEEADIEFYENSANTFGDPIIASVDFSTVGDHQFNAIDNITITDLSTSATPEPSSFILLGTGALSVAGAIRRRVVRG